ncbi:MAG: AI-2E family transporter [SAR324 cluster bacterium]|uniref:AI-2E family transporter n=1 Tax=SAR324 cluster bacterium TaxID=2024889 RepID=A0A7X9IKA4_9DELT|nr:AI-2E family transporter [SAR324 cluster bacterium]
MNGNTKVNRSTASDRLLGWLSRLLVWGVLFGSIYLLRSFFLLIFLTFVFAYIQSRAVDRLALHIKNRVARVALVGLIFLGALVAVGAFFVPTVVHQAKVFAGNHADYLQTVDSQVSQLFVRYPVLRGMFPIDSSIFEMNGEEVWTAETSITVQIAQKLLGFGEQGNGKESLKITIDALKNIGKYLAATISAFLLSLLFSFLIVLDLPRLREALLDMENTKLKFIYAEVAESVYRFSSVLGRALEAQFFIAVINTILTAIGLWILGIDEKIALLSLLVFFCSFIPIVGVFISSIPICLVALQISGFGLLLLAVVMVTIIHLIEAYILNPKIYGAHLHMNPVLVLIVLTIAGKLFGVWGLVLALPACRYFFGEAIRFKPVETTNI